VSFVNPSCFFVIKQIGWSWHESIIIEETAITHPYL